MKSTPDQHGMVSSSARWIVVNTHPHKEQLAIDNLQRQSFVTYCPLFRKRLRRQHGASEVMRPLFPGYVFLRADRDCALLRPVMSTYGVRNVVRCGDIPSTVDDAFIGAFRSREIDGAVCRPAHPFKPGDKAVLAGGPFDGLVATILDMDEKSRLFVLVDMLNRPVKVRVAPTQLSPYKLAG